VNTSEYKGIIVSWFCIVKEFKEEVVTISASVSNHLGVDPDQLATPFGLTIKFSIVLEDIF